MARLHDHEIPGMASLDARTEREVTHHQLVIHSLHDAQASCTCGGWHFLGTGARTREYITEEFNLHFKG